MQRQHQTSVHGLHVSTETLSVVFFTTTIVSTKLHFSLSVSNRCAGASFRDGVRFDILKPGSDHQPEHLIAGKLKLSNRTEKELPNRRMIPAVRPRCITWKGKKKGKPLAAGSSAGWGARAVRVCIMLPCLRLPCRSPLSMCCFSCTAAKIVPWAVWDSGFPFAGSGLLQVKFHDLVVLSVVWFMYVWSVW